MRNVQGVKIQKCTLRLGAGVGLKAETPEGAQDNTGIIVGFAPTKVVQRKPRPYLVLFDSGRTGWYSRKALRREGEQGK